jgi:hypothetical protein
MSRASWIFIFIILFTLIGALHAGEAWLQFFAVLIFDGGLATLWIASAIMLGAVLIRLPGSLGFATAGALGLGIYSLAALILGLLGALNRWTALLLPAISIASFIITHRSRLRSTTFALLRQRTEAWLNTRPKHWWAFLLPISILSASAVAASMPPGIMWLRAGDPHPYDAIEYHLQIPREWMEAKRISPLPHNVYCFFPSNVEMQYLLTMHIAGNPWKAMYVSHFITLGYGLLAIVALYAAAKSVTPDTSTLPAILAASITATIPWLAMLSSVAYNESALILYIILAIAWIIRSLTTPDHRPRSFAIAGLMAGLACGVKYTAAPIAAMLFILLILFPWRLARIQITAGQILTAAATFALTATLAFSPWLLRNLRWTGNPVFPEAMIIFGRGHFSEDQQHRWERAHQPTSEQRPLTKRLSTFTKNVLADQRYAYIFWPAILISLVNTRRTILGTIAILLLLGLIIFWLAFTHLQSRFFILGLPLGALIIAQPPRNRISSIIQTTLAITALIVGSLLTHTLLHRELDRGPEFRRLIGHENLSDFLGDSPRPLLRGQSRIALVGDARAFLYTIPMSRLHYRTIFDVEKKADQPIIDAWLGPDAPRLKRECFILVDQDELDRLYTTYILGLPWKPPPFPTPPQIIPPQPRLASAPHFNPRLINRSELQSDSLRSGPSKHFTRTRQRIHEATDQVHPLGHRRHHCRDDLRRTVVLSAPALRHRPHPPIQARADPLHGPLGRLPHRRYRPGRLHARAAAGLHARAPDGPKNGRHRREPRLSRAAPRSFAPG